MPVRFNAYVPDSAALVRVLDDGRIYRIGRSSDCEVRVDHPSVSRFHAELDGTSDPWSIHDTGSKNGLRVDGQLVRRAEFSASSWFCVGDVYCWLELIDESAAERWRGEQATRRAISRAMSQQLEPALGVQALIPQTLDIVIELSGLERGFVLYSADGAPLRVRASRGFAVDDIASRQFAGSAAAVDRAIAERRSLVCCDTAESPWLGARPSVQLGGIRALVCVPLQLAGRAVGAIYTDSRKPGPVVSELDLELIESVARHAEAALEAARIEDDVSDIVRSVRESGSRAPLWSDLRPSSADS